MEDLQAAEAAAPTVTCTCGSGHADQLMLRCAHCGNSQHAACNEGRDKKERTLVFVRSKRQADFLCLSLCEEGFPATRWGSSGLYRVFQAP